MFSVLNGFSPQHLVDALFQQNVFGMAISAANPAAPQWLMVNQRHCDILGYTADELLTMTALDVTPVEDQPAMKADSQELIDGHRQSYSGEKRYIRKDGGVVWTNRWITLLCEGDSQTPRFVSIIEDITERKAVAQALADSHDRLENIVRDRTQELTESQNRMRAIFDNAPVELYLKDAEGRYIEINRRYEVLFDVKNSEVMGKFPEEIHGEDFGGRARNHDCRILETGEVSVEDQCAETEFGNRILRAVKFPVFDADQNVTGLGAVVTDVTELEEARQEAIKANQVKSEFLSSMSHELRTPMNSILGFGQILTLDDQQPLTTFQKDCVDHIMHSGNHLLELLNQVLDLSKIDSGKIDLAREPIDLPAVIAESLALVRTQADQMGITLNSDVTATATFMGDPTRLRQALINLLSNAIKYNKVGGLVTLTCTDQRGDRVRIAVQDTGEGIAAEQQSELFEPFNRLGKERGEIEGTGIGLYITRQLVEVMQGNIGVESVTGAGSTFWIEFPAVEVNTKPIKSGGHVEQEKTTAAPSSDLTEGLVVYVEDNPANVELMEQVIRRIAHVTLIVARTAEDGLVVVNEKRPNLILMDINLPGMSGIEALSVLRKNPQTRDIPVIAVTAAAMKDSVDAGAAAGFQAYLTKPFDIQHLTETIKTMLFGQPPGE